MKVFYYLFKFLAAGFVFKYFHYSGHCAHRVANLCKKATNAPSRRCGDSLLQPKNNKTFKGFLFILLLVFWFCFKIIIIVTSAYRVANSSKSAANANSRGWGDTLVAT